MPSIGYGIVVLTTLVAGSCGRTQATSVDERHRKLTIDAVNRLREDLTRGCSAIAPYASERFRRYGLEGPGECERVQSALQTWQQFEPELFRRSGGVSVSVMGTAVLAGGRREIEIRWLEGATVALLDSISLEENGGWETIPEPLHLIDSPPPAAQPDRYFPSTENASSTLPGNPPQLP
jgi:hypothetical protein